MEHLILVERDDLILGVEGEHLRLGAPGERLPKCLPLNSLAGVVISGNATLDSHTLRKLCATGKPLVMLDRRHPEASCFCLADKGGNIPRRWQQHQWLANPQRQLRSVRALVRYRIRSQRYVLLCAMQRRADLRQPLHNAICELSQRLQAVARAENIDSLRGLEGAAGSTFFRAYACLFAPSLGFCQRIRRPPTDPVNAALSLGYTLLLAEALRPLVLAGLDPYLGALHYPDYNRPSLGCDLQETGRHLVEAWVWQLFRDRELTAEHFGWQQQACLLKKSGREHFFRAWARVRQPLAVHLERTLYRFLGRSRPAWIWSARSGRDEYAQ